MNEKKLVPKKWLQTKAVEDRTLIEKREHQQSKKVSRAKGACHDSVYEELGTSDGEMKIYRLIRAQHYATQDTEQIKHIKNRNIRFAVTRTLSLSTEANTRRKFAVRNSLTHLYLWVSSARSCASNH